MTLPYSKSAAFTFGLIVIPGALVLLGPELSIMILAPAMFFWFAIPVLVLLAFWGTRSGNGALKSISQHTAIAGGGFLITSGAILGALALR